MKKQSLLIIQIGSLLALSACNPAQFNPNAPGIETTAAMVSISSVTQGSYVAYFSIPELSYQADIIILGNPTSILDQINMARDVENPTKPDPEYYGVGQIFEIQVEEYLKGSGEKYINLIQSQGFLVTRDGPPKVEEIENSKDPKEYVPLVLGKTYLMFLHSSQNRYVEFSKDPIYSGIAHPWLFDPSNPECVRVLDTIEEISRYFPPRPLSEFILQIYQPLSPVSHGIIPYPPVVDTSHCPVDSRYSYPIP